MGTNSKHGFTIIETVLFFGVSSLLAVGILASSGVAITQQRYRDSVNSLRSSLQGQFSEVLNVRNDRSAAWQCNSSGSVAPGGGLASVPRGASECVILGRYIRSYGSNPSEDGEKLQSYAVIGRLKAVTVTPTNDIEALSNYNIALASINDESELLEWGAVMRVPGAADPNLFSVLMVRSPLTGGLRTYVPEPGLRINDANIAAVISTTNALRDLKICVDAPGQVISGGLQAVYLAPNASNQSAVETQSEGSGC